MRLLIRNISRQSIGFDGRRIRPNRSRYHSGVPRSLPAKTFYGTEISQGDPRAAALAQMVSDGLVGVSLIPADLQLHPSYTAFPEWAERLLSASDLIALSTPAFKAAEAAEKDEDSTEDGDSSSDEDSSSDGRTSGESDSESSSGDTESNSDEEEEEDTPESSESDADEDEDSDSDEGEEEEDTPNPSDSDDEEEDEELNELFEIIPVDQLRDPEVVKDMAISELREYGELFDPPVKGVAKAELASEILARLESVD